MKKILCITCVLFFLTAVGSAARGLYSEREDIPVAEGVTLTKVKEFYADHNLSYSYITADLSNEHIGFTLLAPKNGIDTLATVPDLGATRQDTLAAINADFFSAAPSDKAFSLGIEIQDGKLFQSPIYPDTMATVWEEDGVVSMGYLTFHVMVVAPDWEYREIRHINKSTTYYGDILMYTHDYNHGMSPAPGGEVVEVVVEDGKVAELRRNEPPCEIPENGCVLLVSEGVETFFTKHFKVGDTIKFDYYYTPSFDNVDTAFGGGTLLVKHGQALSTYSHVISGYQPRSALGIDKTGTKVTLVAVNGRQEQSRGMTMAELADLMVDLGCDKAINLDGGGSTYMSASTVWVPALHKVNSPTETRRVANAVGITGSFEPGAPAGIMVEADDEVLFVGQSTRLSYALFDEHERTCEGDVTWSSEHGTVTDLYFKAQKEGSATVTAKCGSAAGSVGVYVVDTVCGINPSRDHYVLKPEQTQALSAEVFDRLGHKVTVTDFSRFLITSSDPKVAEVTDHKTITAKKAGNALITVEKDGAKAYISVCVSGDEAKAEAAPMPVYTDPAYIGQGTSTAFRVGAVSPTNNTLLDQLARQAMCQKLAGKPQYAVVGGAADAQVEGFSPLPQGKFSVKEDQNTLYITLNTAKGGIRGSDSTQWTKLYQAVSTTSARHIFILSDTAILGSDSFENAAIRKILGDLPQDVYVISRGAQNTMVIDRGVHYFTLRDIDSAVDMKYGTSAYQALSFTIDTTVSYRFTPVF